MADLQRTLTELLSRALDEAEALAGALEAEREALDARDTDRVAELASVKNDRIEALERVEQARRDALIGAGYTDDPEGMDRAMTACGGGELIQRWQALMGTVERCQQRNQENGIVLETSRRHAQEALNLLRGDSATEALYDPSGHTDGGGGSRTIDRA